MKQGYLTMLSLGNYGRLANGMYQIAGILGIARKNNLEPVFPQWINHDHRDRFGSTEDVDLQKYFEHELPKIPEGIQWNPERPQGWGYHDITLSPGNWNLSGHFQSRKYFANCIDTVQHYLRMKDEAPLNDYVAIHVRLGDYDNGWHPRLDVRYYGPAMALFPGRRFLVFSDDIPACKQMFGDSVDYSEGRDYIQDFKLMKRCQPTGSLVKTPDGDIPIEQLTEGCRVVAYSGTGQVHKPISKLIGRNDGARAAPPGRNIESIGSRPFSGKLIVVESDSGKISKYTPNHLSIVRFGDALINKQVVYLMRKGDQFRVGITGPQSHPRGRKTLEAIGASDVRTRLNSSQADDAWILCSFRERDEALLEEKYVCAKFGIPEVSFDGWRTKDRDRLIMFWERFGSNVEGARKCLSYYGRRFEYPFYTRHQRKNVFIQREVSLPVCNVLDGMRMLDADIYLSRGGKGECLEAWREVKTKQEYYAGPVYSMDVEINHSYVGDGLVTHNCRDFIIGNSSYSAMAAMLGESPEKRVVAPRPWFGAVAGINADDVYCSDWTVINWS